MREGSAGIDVCGRRSFAADIYVALLAIKLTSRAARPSHTRLGGAQEVGTGGAERTEELGGIVPAPRRRVGDDALLQLAHLEPRGAHGGAGVGGAEEAISVA